MLAGVLHMFVFNEVFRQKRLFCFAWKGGMTYRGTTVEQIAKVDTDILLSRHGTT